MSNMQSSMKNNNRRKSHERFKQRDTVEQKKTAYDVPEVSEKERKSIVSAIVDKRKTRDQILIVAIVIITLITIAFVVVKL